MPLRPGSWARARDVFEQALALPPTDRPAYVASACGSDHSLRHEVERMLESHGRAAGFLSTPVAAFVQDINAEQSLEGQRLGPYLITSRIGAGGMGEVYRARDDRLRRDVALKILPVFFAGNPDRLARFQHEAQALAAFNHPNIAAIHGFEVSGDVRALVLELVEGETLADRLEHGAIPVAETLRIARQIAVALEAAHEQGIVHRDLKPANVKITSDGVVKVLDFGLAKLTGPDGSDGSTQQDPAYGATMSPTMTSPALLTGAGVLLGTAAYMAPEQARGKVADKRADIWSLGVVLYEMLTGTRAFEGDTATEVLGAVIHKDLDWARLPKNLPPAAHTVLRRCLQKDPTDRLRDMGDVRLALDGAFTPDAPSLIAPASRRWKRAIGMASAVILALITGGAGVWLYSRITDSGGPIPDPYRHLATRQGVPPLSMSPDGRNLNFAVLSASSTRDLYVHSFDTGEARQLINAVGAPFWSPDNRSLAFASQGKLQRMDAAGDGPAETLCDVGGLVGGTWTSGNVILFGDFSKGGIMQVSATGGTPVQRTKVDQKRDESGHVLPWALPDGRHFLYLRQSKVPDNNGIFVGSIDATPEAQDLRRLVPSVQGAAYAPPIGSGPGHLLFVRDGRLMAQPFDENALELGGEAAPIADVMKTGGFATPFAVSANGAVAYIGDALQSGAVVWVGRSGETTAEITGSLKGVRNPRLSRDGKSLALVVAGDVWRYDLSGRPPIRLTRDGGRYPEGLFSPLWTRDGTRVVYEIGGGRGLASMPADGSGGTPEPASPSGHFHPHGWSPDGREIFATRWPEPGQTQDLVRFQPRVDGQLQMIVATPAREGESASIYGRWLAYTSFSTGYEEVWVRPFSESGPPVRVSPNGGREPVWAASGKELYYLNGSDMMSVAVETGGTFTFKPPTRLFESTSYMLGGDPPSYAVAADGRFVMIKPDAGGGTPITVILNWTERLRQRAVVH